MNSFYTIELDLAGLSIVSRWTSNDLILLSTVIRSF